MKMKEKTIYIRNLANNLIMNNVRMTFDQLATNLNLNGFLTEYETPFNGGRGVAKLVHAVYDRLDEEGLDAECSNVALAFTNAFGEYSYR